MVGRRRFFTVHRFIMLVISLVFTGLFPTWPLAAAENVLMHPDKLKYGLLHFRPPQAQRTVLENGMILYTLTDRELPLVNITVIVRTGTMYDPPGKEGLSDMTAGVMRTGGAGNLKGDDVDEALEFTASTISPSSSTESTSWSVSVIKKDLSQTMDIFSKILLSPNFEEAKLRISKELKLEEIRRITDDPQKFAFREFNRLLYEGNPRGRQTSLSSIRNITREDLVKFHDIFYYPRNIMVAVSGDISQKEAVDMMNRHFGDWRKSGSVVSIAPPSSVIPGPIHYLVKDTPQSIVIMGQMAPAKSSPEHYAFEVLDHMIGSGGFGSRIFQEVRTNRGLAYATGSFYRARADYGAFGTYAMTKTESAPMALALIRSILERSRDFPASQKELDMAKKSIINSFIFEYQSSHQIAFQQMMLEYNKLQPDFLTSYCSHIDRITISDVLNTAKNHLHPSGNTTLVLGTEAGYDHLSKTYKNIKKLRINND
ncbi:MAG: hypothetical protein CSYNP_01383 [Syntrophus sp. SKADARSKE-3]|nr:hypothetical protein [Syntrophus sp. SKADARSKE-3]